MIDRHSCPAIWAEAVPSLAMRCVHNFSPPLATLPAGLIVPHILSFEISAGLAPAGINNWMATATSGKKTNDS